MKNLLTLLLLAVCSGTLAQTLRGRITDAATGEELIGATVRIVENKVGTTTDMDGCYAFEHLATGRYTVEVSYVGYQPAVKKEVLVSGKKEVIVDMGMEAQASSLSEFVVSPRISKEATINTQAVVGGHMLSVEEASRYAGAFEDPARLVTAFSGVASSVTDNGISIHGSAPNAMTWHLEGIEIQSPNHFADAYGSGVSIVSALNSKVLSNSDFFVGGLTSEYTNSLGGVMDMRMRVGNNQKHEHSVQLGTMGAEVFSEGPLSKNHKASYILNYRYALTSIARQTGLLKLDGDQYDFHDFNLKINMPTRKAGTFSVWALGMGDRTWCDWQSSTTNEVHYFTDLQNLEVKQKMLLAGLSHRKSIGKSVYLNSTVAYSASWNNVHERYGYSINADGEVLPGGYNKDDVLAGTVIPDFHLWTPHYDYTQQGGYLNEDNEYGRLRQMKQQLVLNSQLKKTSRVGVTQLGVNYTHHFFDVNLRGSWGQSVYTKMDPDAGSLYKAKDNTGLVSAYLSQSFLLSPFFTLNAGVTGQLFTLNGKGSIEPRAGLQWRPNKRNTFGLGYSLQSKMESIDTYFYQEGGKNVNKDLGLGKSHHLIASYTYRINDNMALKAETFLQHLYHLACADWKADGYDPDDVEFYAYNPTFFPSTNYDSYYVAQRLCNEGKGRIYGLDLSLEQYMVHGFYWSVNGSVYKSELKAQGTDWFDSHFNRSYTAKAIMGKEWFMGKSKRNVLNVSAKYSIQGGKRYTPAHEAHIQQLAYEGIPEAAHDYGTVNLGGMSFEKTNTQRHSPQHIVDFSLNLRLNRTHVSHVIACDILNLLNVEDPMYEMYNFHTGRADHYRAMIAFPNIYYRVEF